MPTEVRINKAALTRHAQGEAVKLIRRGQRQVIAAAKQKAPWDTGALSKSHVEGPIKTTRSRVLAEVAATQEYGLAVHEGTRPHVIHPRKAKALSWQSGQGRVFARSVNHPGTKPRPWLLNSLKQVGPRLGFAVSKS